MIQQPRENPYQVSSDQVGETVASSGEIPIVRVVGFAILTPLAMLFIFLLQFNLIRLQVAVANESRVEIKSDFDPAWLVCHYAKVSSRSLLKKK